MDRKDVKRYISVGLLTALTGVIIAEVGITAGLWVVRETTFPLAVMPTFIYGTYPVAAMWILKFTYGRFGLYLAVDTIFNFGYTFFIMPWLATRGILDFSASLTAFMITIVHGIALYGFQVWQEGIFVRSERTIFSPILQPAAAKQLPNDQENKKDDNE